MQGQEGAIKDPRAEPVSLRWAGPCMEKSPGAEPVGGPRGVWDLDISSFE